MKQNPLIKKTLLCSAATLLLLLTAVPTASAHELTGMRVEYQENPIGIDSPRPRLSWELKTQEGLRDVSQKAFQIEVVNERTGRRVWNSGKRQGDLSVGIAYGGEPLEPETRYSWKATVWTNKGGKAVGTAAFETGLHGAWDGAQWIGGGDDSRNLYAPYTNIFRLSFHIRLGQNDGPGKAAFVYGGNEERMLDGRKNLYHLQAAKGKNYMAAELDVSQVAAEGARLNLYRMGYHPDDRVDQPLHSFVVPKELINEQNSHGEHEVELVSLNGGTNVFLDGRELGWAFLNPWGMNGDALSFPALCEIGYSVPAHQEVSFSQIEIRNYRSPRNRLARFEGQHFATAETPQFQTFDPSRGALPLLRTRFTTLQGKTVKMARIYATARGIYDLYLNGKRVSPSYFNQGLTQYNRTHLYQTFDVTPLLQSGSNALGAELGEGWWSGAITYAQENQNLFGDRQSLLLKMVITYQDGTRQTLVTHPEDWRYSLDGGSLYGSFFHGEVYDARRAEAVKGWASADFDDSRWQQAVEVGLEGTVATEGLQADYSQLRILSQEETGVEAVDTITAIGVTSPRKGLYVYDMGQNCAAVPLIRFSHLKPGTVVRMRYAEVTYPDLPAYDGNQGMVMMENIRSARAQDTYIALGAETETFSPRHTFHGYRYIEISGVDEALPLTDVASIALSSIGQFAAHFETSSPLVNRLWKNIGWSYRSNFLSIPTDCPQRNERMGWSGDLSVFSRTATYMAQVPQFLRRHMRAMRDIQTEDGRFPDVAPVGGGFGGLLWGSAGITVPYESFTQYADTVMLREHYEAMKHYVDYVQKAYIDPETQVIVQKWQGNKLGDWLSLEYERSDKSLLWECYFIYDLQIMARVAKVLGKTADEQHFEALIKKRKEHFKRTYLQAGTLKTIYSSFVPDKKGELVDNQTSYVLPLAFGIVEGDEAQQLLKHLEATIMRSGKTDVGQHCPPYSLMTGFIGTGWINRVLSAYGRPDLAYRLLLQTSYPSWLYSVEQGATTIWERLNSYTHTDGFGGNNGMNSFNHYSFGAVGSWMINDVLGIESDAESAGMQHFLLHPQPDPTGGLTYAKGDVQTLFGRVESKWEKQGSGICYEFSVPGNTTATLTLPVPSGAKVTESGVPVKDKGKGYQIESRQADAYMVALHSGRYRFEVMP